MQYNDVNTFKSIGDDPWEPYFGKLARAQVRDDKKSIAGRVVAVSDRFITLQHLDGRRTLIRTDDIMTLAMLPEAV